MPASHGAEEAHNLAKNWKFRLGDMTFFADYFAYFNREIAQHGRLEVLNKYFAELMPAMWTAAFHCLIHTGFALYANHDESVARGLAYFSVSFRIFDPQFDDIPVDASAASDIWTVLAEIREEKDTWSDIDKIRGFQKRLQFLATQEVPMKRLRAYWARIKAGLEKVEDSVQMAKTMSLQTFELFFRAGANDFFLVHAITAFHALKAVLLHLKDEAERRKALYHFCYAVLATYIVRERPKIDATVDPTKWLSNPTETQCQDMWSYIIDKVIHYDEEHVIKLVYVAKWNFDREDDIGHKMLYLATAKSNLEQIQPDGTGWKF